MVVTDHTCGIEQRCRSMPPPLVVTDYSTPTAGVMEDSGSPPTKAGVPVTDAILPVLHDQVLASYQDGLNVPPLLSLLLYLLVIYLYFYDKIPQLNMLYFFGTQSPFFYLE